MMSQIHQYNVVKKCTINLANEDRLSVRKIVKNKVNIERRFLHSNSVKRRTCKNTSSEHVLLRSPLTSGHSGHKGLIQSGHSGR